MVTRLEACFFSACWGDPCSDSLRTRMNYSGYHQPDVPKVWTYRRCRSVSCDSHRVASSVWSGAQKDLSKHTWQSGCGDAWQESPSISKYFLFLWLDFQELRYLQHVTCSRSFHVFIAKSWRIEGLGKTDQNTMIRSLHRSEFMPAIHHDTSWYSMILLLLF